MLLWARLSTILTYVKVEQQKRASHEEHLTWPQPLQEINTKEDLTEGLEVAALNTRIPARRTSNSNIDPITDAFPVSGTD